MASSPPLPAAVLSDMDGLLLDTETVSKRAFDVMTARHRFKDDGHIFMQLIGRNKAAHQAIFAETLPASVNPVSFDDDWKALYLSMLEDSVPVKPGARELLEWLNRNGVPVALVTSSARAKAVMLMHRAGLFDLLDDAVCGDDVSHGKPAPDIYLKAAARLDQPITDCLALEDSANGVRAAHASGARVVQVVDMVPPDENLLALGHEVVGSLAELSRHFGWGFTD